MNLFIYFFKISFLIRTQICDAQKGGGALNLDASSEVSHLRQKLKQSALLVVFLLMKQHHCEVFHLYSKKRKKTTTHFLL